MILCEAAVYDVNAMLNGQADVGGGNASLVDLVVYAYLMIKNIYQYVKLISLFYN